MATGLGIDIGTHWIKAVQVSCRGKNVTVTGAMKIPNPFGDVTGGSGAVHPQLGQELARAGLRRTGAMGVSGREVILKYLQTPPLPPEKLKMMVDMQIGERLIPGVKGDGGSSLTYDYRILDIPTGLKGDLVVAAGVVKNEYLLGIFKALKKAKVAVTRVTPSAFGLVHAYLATQEVPTGETVVLIDIGHEMLELAILTQENVYFARSAPGGGTKFTAALNRLLQLPHEKIEEYKAQRAQILPEGSKIQGQQELQFQKALKESADSIASSIRSALMFCRTQAKMPNLDYQRIYLSGGGGRMKGLKEYLAQKTQRPVQVLDLYSGLDLRKLDAASARCFEGAVPDMTVALGLAVIDAKPESFHFNLVPEAVSKKRIFWTKTVWAAAAGVALMAGLILPRKQSLEALTFVTDKKEEYEGLVKTTKAKQKAFEEKVAKNKLLAQKVSFYGKQTRLGLVYLNLFTQIRESSPKGVTLFYFGPKGTYSMRMGDKLIGEVFETPLREFALRGYYEIGAIKDFNRVTSDFFDKIKTVPGLEKIELEPDLNTEDFVDKPGQKPFQFNIRLANPDQPINKPTEPETKTASGNAPTSRSTVAKAETSESKTNPK